MRVLVACECSGTVRDQFAARGHDAWSCDLEVSEVGGNHFQINIFELFKDKNIPPWDLMIAHPPCERLCVSGARWKYEKENWANEQEQSLKLVEFLLNAPVPRIALENHVGIISSRIRKPDQVIQPWMFGHPETKATCLWLKNLPLLQRTHRKDDWFCEQEPSERIARVHKLGPSPMRKKLRSWRFKKIAEAMAEQWGNLK